jgi:hypothetical protein
MKKSFKLVAAVAVAAMTLTSCAKKISEADAETQAGKYDSPRLPIRTKMVPKLPRPLLLRLPELLS